MSSSLPAPSSDTSQRLRQLELGHARLEGRLDAQKESLERIEETMRAHQATMREIFESLEEIRAQLAEQRGSRRTLQWAIPVMVSGTAVLAAVATWAATQFLLGGGP